MKLRALASQQSTPALLSALGRLFQRTPTSKGNRQAAFSLIEIVLAIGIVAFAFVGLVGLIPIGLNTFSNALDTSVRSQIVQRFVTDAEQTDFSIIQNQGPVMRYFDDEGTETSQAASIYTAMMTVTTTPLPQNDVSQNMVTLAIAIARNPGRVSNPFDSTSTLRIWKDSAFVARNNNK